MSLKSSSELRNSAKTLGLVLLISLSTVACKVSQKTPESEANIPKKTPLSEQLVMSTLWFQNSLEAQQLYIQSYELAKIKMMANEIKEKGKLPSAVVLDIDETVLDNSAFEARLVQNEKNYTPQGWAAWVNEANAPALPGAVDFINFAQKNDIDVFLISNRKEELLSPTLVNLKKVGVNIAADHVLLKTDTSNKDARRANVKSAHKVILYIGDQLTDFASIYDSPQDVTMLPETKKDSLQDLLNQEFILLPNPMYGTFEQAVYPQSHLSDEEKSQARKKALNTKGL
ncbi:MAG: 5'-nucleotidase, lipoprotein e(P4) family [Salegentibacter sp.]